MPSNWIKQIQNLEPNSYLNSGTGDSVLGGSITTVPSNAQSPSWNQHRPGDKMIVGSEDATALSDVTNVGTLFGGLYTYVATKSGSTGTLTRGRAAFWQITDVVDKLFTVTPDENGTMGTVPFAGVVITATITKGYYGWVQSAGRVYVKFKTTLTGTAAIGQGVWLAAQGAGTDLGRFDVQGGVSTAVTYTNFGTVQELVVGVAVELPVADGIATTIKIPLGRSWILW